MITNSLNDKLIKSYYKVIFESNSYDQLISNINVSFSDKFKELVKYSSYNIKNSVSLRQLANSILLVLFQKKDEIAKMAANNKE